MKGEVNLSVPIGDPSKTTVGAKGTVELGPIKGEAGIESKVTDFFNPEVNVKGTYKSPTGSSFSAGAKAKLRNLSDNEVKLEYIPGSCPTIKTSLYGPLNGPIGIEQKKDLVAKRWRYIDIGSGTSW